MAFCTEKTRRSHRIERYVAIELALPFALCLIGLLSLFLVTDALDAQADLADAGASAREAMVYFLYRQPLNTVYVLPMSVLLASSYTICILGRRNEIAAVRGSGISLLTWGRPFWTLGLGATFATLAITEFVVPTTTEPMRAIREREAVAEKSGAKKQERETLLAFRNSQDNRSWLFEEFADSGLGDNVLVKQFRRDGTLLWEIEAEKARYRGSCWSFVDGMRTEYAMRDGFPQAVQHEPFERLNAPEVTDSPRMIAGTVRPSKDLSTRRMLAILWSDAILPKRTHAVLATAVWYRLAYPFTCMMCALVGVGLNIRSERAGALGGFATAVGIIFVYYLFSQFILLLGRTGRIPPLLAGVLPIALFLVWGARRVYSHR